MNTKLLHGIPLFESLSEDESQIVASRIEVKQWPENSVIINEGDDTNSLYVILNGKVKVFLNDEQGEEIILNYLKEGDYFGEVALLDDGERSASVITTADSYFAVLEKEDFLELMSSHPQLAFKIFKGAAGRLRSLSNNVRSLAANY